MFLLLLLSFGFVCVLVVLDRVLTVLGEWSTSSAAADLRCPTSKFSANPLYVVDVPDVAAAAAAGINST